MTAEAESRSRLARHVEQRIGEMAVEYAEVARVAGFSIETLSKIRKGLKVKQSTYGKLERGLGWRGGSTRDVLSGGEPELLPSGLAVDQRVEAAQRAASVADEDDPVMRAMRAMLEGNSPEAAADILSRVVDGFPPEERDGIWRRLLGQAPLDGAEGQRRVG